MSVPRFTSCLARLQATTAYRRLGRRVTARVAARPASSAEAEEVRRRQGFELGPSGQAASTLLVVRLAGALAGWALVVEPRREGPFDGSGLWALAVRRPFRGLGLGERLVEAAARAAGDAGADRIVVVLRPDNVPALALYRKLGFTSLRTPAVDAYLAERRAAGVDSVALVRPLA